MPSSEPILISDRELRYLINIHTEIRNQFTHFEPTGWSIEISGIPELASLISRIITDILDRGCGFIHLDRKVLDTMRANLIQLSKLQLPTQSTARS